MASADDGPVLVPFTFPELLARQRIALQKTQQQVSDELRARGLEYSSVAVSNWETGKNPPRQVSVVYALEEILDCPGEFTSALGLAASVPQTRLDDFERRLEDLERQIRDLTAELRGGR